MTTEQLAHGFFLEAHFVYGLKPLVMVELQHHLKHELRLLASAPEIIRFNLTDDLDVLNHIRTATAFYLGCHYAIPRPKALLGHQHFQQLIKQIEHIRHTHRHRGFHSFRIQAAGSGSTIFCRLSQQIANETGLVEDQQEGELAIRIFPSSEADNYWTVLCRLTPQPLSVRSWRVIDMPGALNATVAAAMMQLSVPRPLDRVLNLMCGSGTLAIERLRLAPAGVTVGCDTSAGALAAAERNINAAGLADRICLLNQDATQLSFPSQSFDVLAVDLPWGQLIGDHTSNDLLYPLLLQEAARVAVPGARFVLITTEVRLLEQTLQKQVHLWQRRKTLKLAYKNLHPRIYLLQRSNPL